MQIKKRKLYSEEAEASVIAAMLISGDKDREILDSIISQMTVEDFKLEEIKLLFIVISEMYSKNQLIDFVTVTDKLERDNLLESIGGIQYVSNIFDFLPSAVNFQHYVDIVKDYSRLRNVVTSLKQVQETIINGSDGEEVEEELNKVVDALLFKNPGEKVTHAYDALELELGRIKNVLNGKFETFGIHTGFETLDRKTWGLQAGNVYTIGARPGEGKSALALNIVNEAAINQKSKCVLFSLEMTKQQIIQRLLALRTEIPLEEILRAKNLGRGFAKLTHESGKILEGNLFIDDRVSITAQDMLFVCKQQQRKRGLDLIVIDYLQIIKPQKTTYNRINDVSNIMQEIVAMAKILNIPIIVLSQLSRSSQIDDREPTLADLSDSSEVEKGSYLVALIHRLKKINENQRSVDLIIAKHRNGSLFKIRLMFKGNILKFVETPVIEDNEL